MEQTEKSNQINLSVCSGCFALFLTVLSLSLASRAAGPEQEPASWKIKGAEAALEDTRQDVRIRALGKLGELRAVGAASKIADRLKDPDPSLRAAAIRALVAMGEARSYAPQIAACLRESDRNVRLEA